MNENLSRQTSIEKDILSDPEYTYDSLKWYDVSKQDVVNAVRIIIKHCGGYISKREYERLHISKPSHRTIRKKAGSWQSLIEDICGVSDRSKYSNTKYKQDEEETNSTDDSYEHDMDRDVITISCKQENRPLTEEEIIKLYNIDTCKYKIKRVKINSWNIGSKNVRKNLTFDNGKVSGTVTEKPGCITTKLYQTLIIFEPKEATESNIEKLIASIKDYEVPIVKPPKASKSNLIYEISIADLHLSSLCWDKEVGEDYDIDIAQKDFMEVVTALLDKLGSQKVEKILYPVGNDFFHTDTVDNTTTKGTLQDVDSRWPKSFKTGYNLVIESIDMLLQYAPVDLLIIPGNHDRQKMFYMGEVLTAWYHNNKYVSINNEPTLRKYYHYGCNAIGFTHGNEEKIADLPMIMSNELSSNVWADTWYREWHIGHQHKRKETRMLAGDTLNGISIRTIPGLCKTNYWHYMKGFIHSIRAGEGYIWDKEEGNTAVYAKTLKRE